MFKQNTINNKKISFQQKIAKLTDHEHIANCEFNSGRYQVALEAYELVKNFIKLFTQHERARFNYHEKLSNIFSQIGLCHKNMADFSAAIKCFVESLSYNRKRMDIYYELAFSFYQVGNLEEAKENALKVFNFNQEEFLSQGVQDTLSCEVLINSSCIILGDIAVAVGNTEEAKLYFQKGKIYARLAELAFKEGNYDQSIIYCKQALEIKTTMNEASAYSAYYYWGMSISNRISAKSVISDSDKMEIRLAGKLLEKASELNNPIIYYNLAYLYDDERLGNHDGVKALKYYRLAAARDNVNALHNLAIKYEIGEDCIADLSVSFTYFKRAAELGFADSQCELARYYINGEGCEKNLQLARLWAEKAAPHSALAKHYLACTLIVDAKKDNDLELGQAAVKFFKEAIKEDDIGAAFYNLGLLHDVGLFISADFAKAEYYYREAIRLGHLEACDNLLLMYIENLKQSHISDQNYREIENAGFELIEEFKDTFATHGINKDIITIVTQYNLKRHSLSVRANEAIKSIVENNNISQKNKIEKILDELSPKLANTINLSTSILKISDLFDKANNNIALFKHHEHKLINLLKECLERFNKNKFSIRSVCNIMTGVVKFYHLAYNQYFDQILVAGFGIIKKANIRLSLLNVSSLLAVIVRTNLSSNLFLDDSQYVIELFLQNLHSYLKNKDNLANVFYNIAVLDNCKSIFPKFSIKIDVKSIESIVDYSLQCLCNLQLNKKEQHQYFLTAFYFSRSYNLQNFNKAANVLGNYLNNFTKNINEARQSILQKKIYAYVEKYLPGCQAEVIINTLPVDILWKNFIVQVDGPSHFVFINQEMEHVQTPKDYFHDKILLLKLDANNSGNNLYKIIHIDFAKYEEKGNRYIKEIFKKYGVELFEIFAKVNNQLAHNSKVRLNDQQNYLGLSIHNN